MAPHLSLVEEAAKLEISELERLLIEMIDVSRLIQKSPQIVLEIGKLPLYHKPFTRYMILNSDHRIVKEYPTGTIFDAYKIINDNFRDNLPIIADSSPTNYTRVLGYFE